MSQAGALLKNAIRRQGRLPAAGWSFPSLPCDRMEDGRREATAEDKHTPKAIVVAVY